MNGFLIAAIIACLLGALFCFGMAFYCAGREAGLAQAKRIFRKNLEHLDSSRAMIDAANAGFEPGMRDVKLTHNYFSEPVVKWEEKK